MTATATAPAPAPAPAPLAILIHGAWAGAPDELLGHLLDHLAALSAQ